MFELAAPWVLVGLPLPLIFWFLLPQISRPLSIALRVPFFNAMRPIVNQTRTLVRQPRMLLLAVAWCLLLLALAGPRWVGEPQPLPREGYNIMLVLDISPSMEINDMLWHGRRASRLAVVKQAAMQFVRDRKQDNLGLILFGERAYLLTPLTYDHQNVLMRLDDATVGLAGQTTSIGNALGLAIKRLQNIPAKGRMIILLTDGVNNSGVLSPLKAAELARNDGIKVYTIGLNTQIDPQSFSGLFMAMNGGAELDEKTLKSVSSITGGQYFRATDSASLHRIYHSINRMTTVPQKEMNVRPQHEYYPWPLFFSLVLCVYLLKGCGNE